MSSYEEQFILAALPLILFDGLVVQHEREAGMPGSATDPRKAQDPHVMMIDVRRAWDGCTWLTHDQRVALLSIAMFGGSELAGAMVQVPRQTLDERQEAGLKLMTSWLNSTIADREAWEEEWLREVSPIR